MCIAGGAVKTFAFSGGNTIERSAARAASYQVAAHDHLFFEGDLRDHVHVIEAGWLKLYRTLVDGQRQIVGFANAGSVLGLESDLEYLNSCEAITPVTVRAIPVGRLADVCLRDPALAEQLLRQVGRQLGAAQAQLAAVGAQCAEQKLANFLLTIADLCDVSRDGDFDLPMRRGDMAEFLGLRLETVSRKMSEFQRLGWIRMTSLYHCRILRRQILSELAQGSHGSGKRGH